MKSSYEVMCRFVRHVFASEITMVIFVCFLMLTGCNQKTEVQVKASDVAWEYCTLTINDSQSNASTGDWTINTEVDLVMPDEVKSYTSINELCEALGMDKDDPISGRIAGALNALGAERWEVAGVTRDSHVVGTGPFRVETRVAYTLKRMK